MSRPLQTAIASCRHLLSPGSSTINQAYICLHCLLKEHTLPSASLSPHQRRGTHSDSGTGTYYPPPSVNSPSASSDKPTSAPASDGPEAWAHELWLEKKAKQQLESLYKKQERAAKYKPQRPGYEFKSIKLANAVAASDGDNGNGCGNGHEDDDGGEVEGPGDPNSVGAEDKFVEQQEQNDLKLSPELKQVVTNRLAEFRQFSTESDVDGAHTLLEDRLVDMPELKYNYDLWRTLLLFRRRVYGDEGVKAVYSGMILRKVDMPTSGPNADKIWDILLSTGIRDMTFRRRVNAHMRYLSVNKGLMWPGTYEKMIKTVLLTDPKSVLKLHDDLIAQGHKPPSWPDFFVNIAKEVAKLEAGKKRATFNHLRGIHTRLQEPKVYATLIPFLGKTVTMTETYKWHKLCLANRDWPENSEPANCLFEYLGMAGIMAEIKALLDSFTQRSIPVTEGSLCALVTNRQAKEDVLAHMVKRLREGTISKDVFGDKLWGLLMGAKDLKVSTVINLMSYLELKEMGKSVLWALLNRVKSIEQHHIYLHEMWEKGMTVPQEMAKEVYAEFLEQEMQGKEGKAKKLDKYHYDEMFTAAIKKKDRASALHVLAEMRAFSIPVRPAALHFFLRTLLLRPRIRGHAPKTLPPPHIVKDDLVAAINTLVGCLKAGMYVPPQFWWEVFKRLGMNQQLEDLERLAAFLVEWYHPARSAVMLKRYVGVGVGGVTVDASASTSSTTSTTTTFTSLSHSISDAAPNPDLGGSDAGHLPTVDPSGDPVPLTPYTHTPAISFLYFDPPRIIPTTIRPSHRASPVRLLFPAAFFRAITEWGFLGIFRRIPVLTDFPPLPPPYAKVKDQRRQTDITWGLRLAYYLHEAGVHVDPRVLLRAVAVRARAIYGKRPDRLRSRLNVSTRKILREEFPTLESFVREVNTVWRRLVGEESAVLFSTSLWKGIGHVDLREQVMEAVVLGRQETVDRRLWRRWKGMLGKGHEVTGTVWRDRNGRWRMSRNVLRRALRIKRTWDERARGVLGSWNTARGVAERHEGTGVDWWGRQSAGAGVGAEAGAAGASEDKKELWETEGWFDEFLKQESKTPDSTEPAAHPAPVLDRQLTGFPSVYHTPLQPQLQGQSEYFHGQHQKTSQGFRRLGHHSQMANDEYDEWYSQEAKRAKKRARRKRRLEREYQEWQAEAREVWELYGEPPQAGGKGVQEVMGRPVTVRGVDGRWRGMERRGGNVGGGSGGGRIGSGDGGYGRFV